MKAGTRALGVAESFRVESDAPSERGRSTVAGTVVRADRVVDGVGYRSCTVGDTDVTEAICRLVDDLGRPDVRYVLIGAVAPAWYNVLDLSAVYEHAQRPVLAVTFEESEGLEAGLEDAFSGAALEERLERYRRLPERRPVSVNDETVYVRSVGLESDEAADVVRDFTPEGGRPEPIRVARQAARAADAYADSLVHGG
ncbi:endonuclease dU [Natronococcus roseus]|uniref:endonuclease dU n=1 Tax=Natronococcus roseus TaxID=1052014 RepID=UPI00374CCE88